MPSQPDDALDAVRSLLRHHEGALAFGDRRAKVRFVHAGSGSGEDARALIMPVEPAVLLLESTVVFCPDETESHVQVMVSPREITRPESSALVDKWIAHHGHVSARKWGTLRIEGLRTFSNVVDYEDLITPGLEVGAEARLVKRTNADRALLAGACRRLTTAEVADPLCVGVDDLGIDVRARFGIVRLEFDRLCSTEADAARAIDALLGRSGPA